MNTMSIRSTAALILLAGLQCRAGTIWDGGGTTDTGIATDSNWDGDAKPDLSSGTSVLSFGTGGSTATITGDVNVNRIIINRNANFQIADGEGSLSIGSGGIQVALPNTTARTHTISESNLLLGANQTWGITNNTGGARLNVSSTIDDGSGTFSLTKDGSGTLELSGNNTFNGNVNVLLGKLRITHANALGTGTKYFDMQGGSRSLELSGGITLTNTMTLRISSNSFDAGGLSSVDGLNTINGIVYFTSGNPSLNIASSGTSTLVLANNLTYTVGGDSRPLHLGGSSTQTNTIAGVISQSAGATLRLVKQSAGLWILAGNNSYTGTTTIAGGTLSVGTIANGGTSCGIGRAPASADNLVFSGGTLRYTGATAISDRAFTIATNTLAVIEVTQPDTSLTLASATTLNPAGGLRKTGAGTLALGSASTYTGITQFDAGRLSVGAINNGGEPGGLGAATANATNLVFNGGTLAYTGATATSDRAFTINGGKTGTVEVVESSTTLTLPGATGATTSGVLVKQGAGTLVLGGANTHTGGTIAQTGVLRIGMNDALPSGGSLKIASTGTFAVSNLTQTVAALTTEAGGTLQTTVTPEITCGTLVVSATGTVSVDGLAVMVSNPGTLDSQRNYTVLKATNGTLTGTPTVEGLTDGWLLMKRKNDTELVLGKIAGSVIRIF